jgi:multicomponent K+:H+ antiporter subunit D
MTGIAPSPDHLLIAPILIPVVTAALMLLYDERRWRTKLALGFASSGLLIYVAIMLVAQVQDAPEGGNSAVGFYLLGNWPTPYGIVLVLDRLAATMLLLTALLSVPAQVAATAGWDRRGRHFHALFQLLLMGLNGAFLTGDLFNLFVFFEVLLAASYGLLLHGSGESRVRSGLHYVAINLTASMLFLLGVSLIYGATGTLNMADMALRIRALDPRPMLIFHAGAALLGVAFLVKAAMWPFGFWLSPAYSSAAAPVGAVFAVMTKVGVYAVLRLGMLLFSAGAATGPSLGFGAGFLVAGGLATIGFAIVGLLAAGPSLGRMAGQLVVISSGTLLAVAGFSLWGAEPELLAAALYYLFGSTLAAAALFLLTEPIARERGDPLVPTSGSVTAAEEPPPDASVPPEEPAPAARRGFGQALGDFGEDRVETEDDDGSLPAPARLTLLSIGFVACGLILAGLPPLSGFLGKVGMISAAMRSAEEGLVPAGAAWAFAGLLLLAGLATTVALARYGIRTFWAGDDSAPPLRAREIAPALSLIALVVLMSVRAEPAMDYLTLTARALHAPQVYIVGVLGASTVPADDPGVEQRQDGGDGE